MNYRHVYMLIISQAKSEQSKGLRVKGNGTYYEGHHILPRSLFPNWLKRKSNIVLLTAKEHFFCHQLLTKIYPKSKELRYALNCFVNFKRYKGIVNSRTYQKLKDEYSKERSICQKGENNSNYGRKWTPEMRSKISKLNKGRKRTEIFKANLREYHWYTNGFENIHAKECPIGFKPGRTLSEKNKESIKKAGLARKGRSPWNKNKKMSADWIELHPGNRGKVVSDVTRQKISETLKKRNANLTDEERQKRSEVLKASAKKCLDTKKRNGTLKCSEATKAKIKLAALNRPKGRKWYNNGLESKMLFEKPEGWFEGRIRPVRETMN